MLSFYNERIANELFLRTARERDSVLRLVALIGYRPRPGLAATAMLAFALDAGATTRIRKGLQGDEHARARTSARRPTRRSRRSSPMPTSTSLPVFAPPAPVQSLWPRQRCGLIVSRPEPLALGDRLLVFGLGTIEEKKHRRR